MPVPYYFKKQGFDGMEIVVLIIRKTEPTIDLSKPRGDAFGFFFTI